MQGGRFIPTLMTALLIAFAATEHGVAQGGGTSKAQEAVMGGVKASIDLTVAAGETDRKAGRCEGVKQVIRELQNGYGSAMSLRQRIGETLTDAQLAELANYAINRAIVLRRADCPPKTVADANPNATRVKDPFEESIEKQILKHFVAEELERAAKTDSAAGAKTNVIILTGIDRNGEWISPDFGRTRTYIANQRTTFNNPYVEFDEWDAPPKPDPKTGIDCRGGGCKSFFRKIVRLLQKQPGTAAKPKDARQPAPESKPAAEPKDGSDDLVDMLAQFLSGDMGPMASTRIPNLPASAAMTESDAALAEDQTKLVKAVEHSIIDAYVTVYQGVFDPDYAIFIIAKQVSDNGIAHISRTVLKKDITLTAEQRAQLNYIAYTRIKDLRLSPPKRQVQPDNANAAGQSTTGQKNAVRQQSTTSTKKATGTSNAPAKATKKTAAQSAPAQNNEIGQQILNSVIQGGIQYGIGRALRSGEGGGRSHQGGTPAAAGQGAKPQATTTAKQGAGGAPAAAPGKSYLFQGFTVTPGR